MAVTGIEAVVLLVGRVLFGGVLAFMGLNHFLNTDDMTAYAAQKSVPAPRLSVLGSGAALVIGGLGITLGTYPLLASGLVAVFLLASAVLMHGFWAVPAEDRRTEMTQFLKNVVMAGGALILAAVSLEVWAYSLGIGLF